MREAQDEEKEELPFAVDSAASVILESKRKEALVSKNRSVEEKPVRSHNFRYRYSRAARIKCDSYTSYIRSDG